MIILTKYIFILEICSLYSFFASFIYAAEMLNIKSAILKKEQFLVFLTSLSKRIILAISESFKTLKSILIEEANSMLRYSKRLKELKSSNQEEHL
jgi:hypothetical protein